MDRAHEFNEFKTDQPTFEMSLKQLRQHLNQLRREARRLDQPAVEECLSLAISLTSPRQNTN